MNHNLTRKQLTKINRSVLALVASANEGQSVYRQVTPLTAFTIAQRSLEKNSKLPFSIKEYLAARDVSDFISVMQKNKTNLQKRRNTDLLPVCHPASTKKHAMTASALRAEQGRWYAADPRITNEEARGFVASAFASAELSAEESYYLARLSSLPQGSLPLAALTAAFGDGNSRAARSARAKLQRRDRKGRFAWMGGGMSALVSRTSGGVNRLTGRTISQGVGNDNTFDLETPDGTLYRVPAGSSEASRGYLESADSPDGFSPVEAKNVGGTPTVAEADLVKVEAPNGFRPKEYDGAGKQYTDDAYNVTKLDHDDPDQQEEIPDSFFERDAEGKSKLKDGKPVYMVTRDDGTPVETDEPMQSWGDVQDAIRVDEIIRDREEGREPDPIATLDNDALNRVADIAEQENRDPNQVAREILSGEEGEAPSAPEAGEGEQEGFNDPTGFNLVSDTDSYLPEGRTDQDSSDYTDDPSILAQRYNEADLTQALRDAVTVGPNGEPAENGELEFDEGAEEVPAQALYDALKEQGADAPRIMQGIYDEMSPADEPEAPADPLEAFLKKKANSRNLNRRDPNQWTESYDNYTIDRWKDDKGNVFYRANVEGGGSKNFESEMDAKRYAAYQLGLTDETPEQRKTRRNREAREEDLQKERDRIAAQKPEFGPTFTEDTDSRGRPVFTEKGDGYTIERTVDPITGREYFKARWNVEKRNKRTGEVTTERNKSEGEDREAIAREINNAKGDDWVSEERPEDYPPIPEQPDNFWEKKPNRRQQKGSSPGEYTDFYDDYSIDRFKSGQDSLYRARTKDGVSKNFETEREAKQWVADQLGITDERPISDTERGLRRAEEESERRQKEELDKSAEEAAKARAEEAEAYDKEIAKRRRRGLPDHETDYPNGDTAMQYEGFVVNRTKTRDGGYVYTPRITEGDKEGSLGEQTESLAEARRWAHEELGKEPPQIGPPTATMTRDEIQAEIDKWSGRRDQGRPGYIRDVDQALDLIESAIKLDDQKSLDRAQIQLEDALEDFEKRGYGPLEAEPTRSVEELQEELDAWSGYRDRDFPGFDANIDRELGSLQFDLDMAKRSGDEKKIRAAQFKIQDYLEKLKEKGKTPRQNKELSEEELREKAAQYAGYAEGTSYTNPDYDRDVAERVDKINRALDQGNLKKANGEAAWLDRIVDEKGLEPKEATPEPEPTPEPDVEPTPEPETPETPEEPEVSEVPELPQLFDGLTDEEKRIIAESGAYEEYLPENATFETPDGYYEIDSDPFSNLEGNEDFDPLNIANNYDSLDLSEALAAGLRPDAEMTGYGTIRRVDEDGEESSLNVPLEAIRDALQMQGVDTNELIKDVYDEAPGETEEQEEVSEPEVSEPTAPAEPEEVPGEPVEKEEVDSGPIEITENGDGTVTAVVTDPEGNTQIIFTAKDPSGDVDLIHTDENGVENRLDTGSEADLEELNDQAEAYARELAGESIADEPTPQDAPEVTPDTPEEPAEPTEPEEPVTPEEPETPAEPTTPEEPVTPDEAEEPATPDEESIPTPDEADPRRKEPIVIESGWNAEGGGEASSVDENGGEHKATSTRNPDGTYTITYTDPDGNQIVITERAHKYETIFIAQEAVAQGVSGSTPTARTSDEVSDPDEVDVPATPTPPTDGEEPPAPTPRPTPAPAPAPEPLPDEVEEMEEGFISKRTGQYYTPEYIEYLFTADPSTFTPEEAEDFLDVYKQLSKEERNILKKRRNEVTKAVLKNGLTGRFPEESSYPGQKFVTDDDEEGLEPPSAADEGEAPATPPPLRPTPGPGDPMPGGEGRTIPDPDQGIPSRPDIPEQEFYYVDPGGKKTKVKFNRDYVRHLFSSSPSELTNQEMKDLLTMLGQMPDGGETRYGALKRALLNEYVNRQNGVEEPITKYPGDRYQFDADEDGSTTPSPSSPGDSDTPAPAPKTPRTGQRVRTRKSDLNRRSRDLLADLDESLRRLLDQGMPDNFYPNLPQKQREQKFQEMLAELEDTLEKARAGLRDYIKTREDQEENREVLENLADIIDRGRRQLARIERGGLTSIPSDDREPGYVHTQKSLDNLSDWIEDAIDPDWEPEPFTPDSAEPDRPRPTPRPEPSGEGEPTPEPAPAPEPEPELELPFGERFDPEAMLERMREKDDRPGTWGDPRTIAVGRAKQALRALGLPVDSGLANMFSHGITRLTYKDLEHYREMLRRSEMYRKAHGMYYGYGPKDEEVLKRFGGSEESFRRSFEDIEEYALYISLMEREVWGKIDSPPDNLYVNTKRDFDKSIVDYDKNNKVRRTYSGISIENFQRVDEPPMSLEEIRGMSQEEISRRVNQRVTAVLNDIQMRKLESDINSSSDLDEQAKIIFSKFLTSVKDSPVEEASTSLDLTYNMFRDSEISDTPQSAEPPDLGDLTNRDELITKIKRMMALGKKPMLSMDEKRELADIANGLHPVFYGSNANPDDVISGSNFLQRAFDSPVLRDLVDTHLSNKGVQVDERTPSSKRYEPKPEAPGPKAPSDGEEGEDKPKKAAKKSAAKKASPRKRKSDKEGKLPKGMTSRMKRAFDYTQKVLSGEVSLSPKRRDPIGTPLPDLELDFSDEEYPPTDQQVAIIKAILSGNDTVARAVAGSGKTSTLAMAARQLEKLFPDRNALYIPFNKSVQMEALERMPDNVHPVTGDAAAVQASIASKGSEDDYSFMNDRMNAWGSDEVEEEDEQGNKVTRKTPKKLTRILDIVDYFGVQNGKNSEGEEVGASDIVYVAMEAVRKFTVSADDEVLPKHFEEIGIENPTPELLDLARRMWADKTSPDGKMAIFNSDITKKWALTRPDLSNGGREFPPLDLVFVDEAQDLNPVMSKIFRDQNIQIVYVGDSQQAIYQFRGAVDELDKVEATHDLPLTESFRFGPEVAAVANRFLTLLGANNRVIGRGGPSTVVDSGSMEDPDAILSRTTLGAMLANLEEIEKGRRVATSANLRKEIIQLTNSIKALRMGDLDKVRHQEVAKYSSWGELIEDYNNSKLQGRLQQLFPYFANKESEDKLKQIVSQIKFPYQEGLTAGEYIPEVRPEDVEDKTPIKLFAEARPRKIGDARAQSTRYAEATVVRNADGTVDVYVWGQVIGARSGDMKFDLDIRNFELNKQGFPEEESGIPVLQNGPNKGNRRKASKATFENEEEAFKALNEIRKSWQGVQEDEYDVYSSTGHVSKGLEYDRVKVNDDFKGPKIDEATGKKVYPSEEELNLAYVIVTRAKKELDPGSLDWIFSEVSEDEANAPAKENVVTNDVPGDKVLSADPTISPEFKSVLNSAFSDPGFLEVDGPDQAIELLNRQRNLPGMPTEKINDVIESIRESATPEPEVSTREKAQSDLEILERLNLNIPPESRQEISIEALSKDIESEDNYQDMIDMIKNDLGGEAVGNGLWRIWKTEESDDPETKANLRSYEIVIQRNSGDNFSVLHRVVQLRDENGEELRRPKVLMVINTDKKAHSTKALKGIADANINEVIAARFNPSTKKRVKVSEIFRNKAAVNKVEASYNQSLRKKRISGDNVTEIKEGDRVFNHMTGQWGTVVSLVPVHDTKDYKYRDYINFKPDGLNTKITRMPAKNVLRVDPITGNWDPEVKMSPDDIPDFFTSFRRTKVVPPTRGWKQPPMSTKERRKLVDRKLTRAQIEEIEKERDRRLGFGDGESGREYIINDLEGNSDPGNTDIDFGDDDDIFGEEPDMSGYVVPPADVPQNWEAVPDEVEKQRRRKSVTERVVPRVVSQAKKQQENQEKINSARESLKAKYPQASDQEIDQLLDEKIQFALQGIIEQEISDLEAEYEIGNYGVYRSSRGTLVTVSDPDATPEQVQTAMRSIDRVESRAFVPGMNYYLTNTDNLMQINGYGRKEAERVNGVSVASDHSILLKSDNMDDATTKAEMIDKLRGVAVGSPRAREWSSAPDAPASDVLIAHELAHSIDQGVAGINYDLEGKGPKDLYGDDGVRLLEKWMNSREASNYGKTSKQEAYAEAFASWFFQDGNAKFGPVTREVAEFFGWPDKFPQVQTAKFPDEVPIDPPITDKNRNVGISIENFDANLESMSPVVTGKRIFPFYGKRRGLKDNEAANEKLVKEGTTTSELSDKSQEKIQAGLEALEVTPEELDQNISDTLDRAIEAGGDQPEGTDWYNQANDIAQGMATDGTTVEQSSGMIAALSPQQSWGDNIAAAQYAQRALSEDHEVQVDDLINGSVTKKTSKGKQTKSYYEWAEQEVRGTDGKGKNFDGTVPEMPTPDELRGKKLSDLDPYVAAAIIKAHAQMGYKTGGVGSTQNDGDQLSAIDDLTGNSGNVKFTSGTSGMGKAVRIFRGEDVDDVLTGHKVRSFYNNVADPDNPDSGDVTVDSHAFSAAMGRKFASSSLEYKFFSGSSNKPSEDQPSNPKIEATPVAKNATDGLKGLYPAFADAYRRVAAARGLTPAQLQAIVWIQWRKENPSATRGGSSE